MEHEKIERINELARLKKQRPLTEKELAERDALRREYLDEFRANMAAMLDNVYIKNDDGSETKLEKKH